MARLQKTPYIINILKSQVGFDNHMMPKLSNSVDKGLARRGLEEKIRNITQGQGKNTKKG